MYYLLKNDSLYIVFVYSDVWMCMRDVQGVPRDPVCDKLYRKWMDDLFVL